MAGPHSLVIIFGGGVFGTKRSPATFRQQGREKFRSPPSLPFFCSSVAEIRSMSRCCF